MRMNKEEAEIKTAELRFEAGYHSLNRLSQKDRAKDEHNDFTMQMIKSSHLNISFCRFYSKRHLNLIQLFNTYK